MSHTSSKQWTELLDNRRNPLPRLGRYTAKWLKPLSQKGSLLPRVHLNGMAHLQSCRVLGITPAASSRPL